MIALEDGDVEEGVRRLNRTLAVRGQRKLSKKFLLHIIGRAISFFRLMASACSSLWALAQMLRRTCFLSPRSKAV